MWCDAHNHLHDSRLDPWRDELIRQLPATGISAAVVNGTPPDDWPRVASLCSQHPALLPAFGIHPWQAPHRPPDWESTLESLLLQHPEASIGEIGLDAWIEGHNLADQSDLFLAQIQLASKLDRPVTIHCVRAWEPLRQLLLRHPMPHRGFLLHAFSGPPALIPFFVARGARFSFSPYFLHPRKTPARLAFQSIPLDRILIETDAPDLPPPADFGPFLLPNGAHDPRSLPAVASLLAADLGLSPQSLAAITTTNFQQLFTPHPPSLSTP